MIDGLLDALKLTIQILRSRARRGELLMIDDLFSITSTLPENTQIFCIDGTLAAPFDISSPITVSPGLSFIWTENGLEKFGSTHRLKQRITDFCQSQHYGQIYLDNSTYLYTPDDTSTLTIVHSLARGVKLLINHSLNTINKNQEPLDALSRDLITAEANSGGRFGLSDLASYLKQATRLEFGLLHLAQSAVAPLARTITVSTASLSERTLSSLVEFLHLPKNSFLPEYSGVLNPFPAIPLPQNSGAELIVNAGLWGKPLATVVPGREATRILLIPITRPFGPRASHEEHTTLAAVDLLFSFTDTLDRRQIERLRACVDTFSQHRFGARRFNLLAQLQGRKLHAPQINFRLRPFGHPTDTSSIDTVLLPMLNDVLYTTSAHSVSVRLYDPQTQALVVAASADGSAGQSDLVPPNQPIAIRNRIYTSVVAFTFINGSQHLPYVYLPKISPPIRRFINGKIKLNHRVPVPKEYRDLGLQGPLITRSLTRSEICFALMRGHLAFGTLNLEAPYPSAFDQDIDYLNLVKTGIERLYDSVDQKIDGPWLIANAARSDAVHQLWQYQESGEFFSAEQNNMLRLIFPPRSDYALIGHKKMSSIKKQVKRWIFCRWEGTLRRQVLKMVKFDHVSDCPVDAYFLEALFVILRNIIQNSVKHGEPLFDLLFIDDRAWFGSRRTFCLRIYYRSSNTVSQQVIDKLGSAPIELPMEGRTAYGMYNVGLLTRLLGGNLHVSSQVGSSRLIIEVHLPIPEYQS